MKGLIFKVNQQLTVHRLLIFFWTMFWLLNGLDKFFNEEHFFGVTRDEKFIKYFASIDLSADLALFSLYGCGILETVLGLAFLFCTFYPRYKYLTLLSMKLSMLIFVVFSSFDILFGDRTELWEHGTFFAIALVSWMFFQKSISDKETSGRIERGHPDFK